MGWLTGEELLWDAKGRLLTHSASTYQIPAISDAPAELHVTLLPDAAQRNIIHGSKAVGEPPLMLAISVREAIRDAVAAFGAPGGEVRAGGRRRPTRRSFSRSGGASNDTYRASPCPSWSPPPVAASPGP